MARRKFTEEEMDHLRKSPYVLEVRPSTVHFSVEFKEKIWNALQVGMSAREAVIELSIDPEVLGATRMTGIMTMVRKEARSGNGFKDLNTYGAHVSNYANPEVKVRYLEQQLAYKNQEIEFLKKIVSLGKGAAES